MFMLYANHTWSIFFRPDNLQDLHEKPNNVDVYHHSSKNIVVKCKLLMPSSQNQLSINDQIDTVHTSQQNTNRQAQWLRFDDERIHQWDSHNNEEQASKERWVSS